MATLRKCSVCYVFLAGTGSLPNWIAIKYTAASSTYLVVEASMVTLCNGLNTASCIICTILVNVHRIKIMNAPTDIALSHLWKFSNFAQLFRVSFWHTAKLFTQRSTARKTVLFLMGWVNATCPCHIVRERGTTMKTVFGCNRIGQRHFKFCTSFQRMATD